jgi:hypothetical protein
MSRAHHQYLPPLLLVLLVVAATLGAAFATRLGQLRGPVELPDVVARAPQVSPRYFDRPAIQAQLVEPPGLVRTILLPSLGAPSAVAAGGHTQIVLERPLATGESLALVPREVLAPLDELLYAVPPMPAGADIFAARLASAEAELAAPRGDDARATREPREARTLSAAEQAAVVRRFRDRAYSKRFAPLLQTIQDESGDDLRDRIERVRERFDQLARGASKALIPLSPATAGARCEPLGIGSTCALEVALPDTLPIGLFALALQGPDGHVRDFQMNAVHRPRAPDAPPELVVAGDLQWGDNPSVSRKILSWVSLMNALAVEGRAPEAIIVVGDIVDCGFGSARSLWTKLFAGATDYPRDYLQAWLALAALRVPAHLAPGNHDGYRFEDAVGQTRSDGLLLFESTFGPLNHSFDRPPYRFVLLNSYDLPIDSRTTRRGDKSTLFESVSDKLNVLNWGGGLGRQQLAWLRNRLGLDGAPSPGLAPVLALHHDPRGAYPALRPHAADEVPWTTLRHLPFGVQPSELRALQARPTPHSDQTEEIHVGHFTPLRDAKSGVRSTEWFDLGGGVNVPISIGYPGWSRYQQEWHARLVFRRSFFDVREPDELTSGLADPADVLRTIVEGRVGVIVKGHDNRFGRAHMEAGECIFGRAAEEELLRSEGDDALRGALGGLHLRVPLSVFHDADVADIESDGHGFLWLRVRDGQLEALEIDHR